MKTNLNTTCTVVLTSFGTNVYNSYYADMKYYKPKEKHEGDSLRDSLWHIMQVFGPQICLGGKVPFELNELILEN